MKNNIHMIRLTRRPFWLVLVRRQACRAVWTTALVVFERVSHFPGSLGTTESGETLTSQQGLKCETMAPLTWLVTRPTSPPPAQHQLAWVWGEKRCWLLTEMLACSQWVESEPCLDYAAGEETKHDQRDFFLFRCCVQTEALLCLETDHPEQKAGGPLQLHAVRCALSPGSLC